MKKSIKFFILIVICLILLPASKLNSVSAAPNYKAMCVLEANTGKIIEQYNADAQLAMASTTKIITAIVAIENCTDFNKIITVANESVGIEGTSIYLKKNEQITIDNLLYGLILASGNDAAMALAYEIGGSEENFVNLMNDFATKLELKNTNLVNPHGLDAKEHFTSASDLAKITAYALNNDKFLEVVSTKNKVFGNETSSVRYLKNKNKLLFSQDGCIGVKTGFTDNAGRCLVNACDKDGLRIISVVFNCGPMFEECDRLTKKTLNTYEMKEFVAPYNFVGVVPVLNGDKMEISAATIKGYKDIIKKEDANKYKVEFNLKTFLEAPISNQTIVGDVKVLFNDEVIYSDNLYSIDETDNINLKYKLDNIIEKWFN